MTILEHFEKAKADGHQWADAAIRNTSDLMKGRKVEILHQALTSAFDFELSPEGLNYWLDVYDSLFQNKLDAFWASIKAIHEDLEELKIKRND